MRRTDLSVNDEIIIQGDSSSRNHQLLSATIIEMDGWEHDPWTQTTVVTDRYGDDNAPVHGGRRVTAGGRQTGILVRLHDATPSFKDYVYGLSKLGAGAYVVVQPKVIASNVTGAWADHLATLRDDREKAEAQRKLAEELDAALTEMFGPQVDRRGYTSRRVKSWGKNDLTFRVSDDEMVSLVIASYRAKKNLENMGERAYRNNMRQLVEFHFPGAQE